MSSIINCYDCGGFCDYDDTQVCQAVDCHNRICKLYCVFDKMYWEQKKKDKIKWKGPGKETLVQLKARREEMIFIKCKDCCN